MRTLFDAVAFILVCVFFLTLIFIFQGEPDLWDVWKQKAMQEQKP